MSSLTLYASNINAANAGAPQAMLEVARAYMDGDKGVEKDASRALEWAHMAAIQRYAPAQEMIGDSYRDGKGFCPNIKIARIWYKMSFDNVANGEVANKLGMLYQSTLDYDDALEWFICATALGNKRAYVCICRMRDIYRMRDDTDEDTYKDEDTHKDEVKDEDKDADENDY